MKLCDGRNSLLRTSLLLAGLLAAGGCGSTTGSLARAGTGVRDAVTLNRVPHQTEPEVDDAPPSRSK